MFEQTHTSSTLQKPQITPCNLFKYRLKELFICTFGEKAAEARREFAKQQGLHIEWIRHDFRIKLTDSDTIPASRLNDYATYLKKEVTELRNRINQTVEL